MSPISILTATPSRGGPLSAPAVPPPKPSSACSNPSAWASATPPTGCRDRGTRAPRAASCAFSPLPLVWPVSRPFPHASYRTGVVRAAPASSCLCIRGDTRVQLPQARPACSGHRCDCPLYVPRVAAGLQGSLPALPWLGHHCPAQVICRRPGRGWADVLSPTPQGRLPPTPTSEASRLLRLGNLPGLGETRSVWCRGSTQALSVCPVRASRPRPQFPVTCHQVPGGSEDRLTSAVPRSAVRPASELVPHIRCRGLCGGPFCPVPPAEAPGGLAGPTLSHVACLPGPGLRKGSCF